MLSTAEIYTIDFMRVITKIPRALMEVFLDIDELKAECINFIIRDASNTAHRAGYESTLCITAPTKRFFELLAFYDLGDYKISYLEVAKDSLRSSMDEARFESYELKRTMVKKYTLNPFTYDVRDRSDDSHIKLDKGLFSDLTNYLGGKELRYIVYARISKLVNAPCIHSEWRISGAGNIRRLTGISTIEDCINFDQRQFYEKTTMKYIFHAEINHDRLGKFIKGYDGRRKSYTKRQLMSIGVAAAIFITVYKITSTAELVNTIKKLKEEINSHSGQKNIFQKRILSINSNCAFVDAVSIE